MNKKSYIIGSFALTLFILSFTSCTFFDPIKGNGKVVRKEIQLAGYEKIEAEGLINITIAQGTYEKLEVETDENLVAFIETKVKNNTLKIKNKKSIISTKGIAIYLTLKTLTEIKLSGNSSICSSDKINLDKLAIEATGNSKLNLTVNCFDLNAVISDNSKMIISGIANNAEIKASDQANINALDMIVENMKIDLAGNAKAKVNVLTKLDAKAIGNAKIEYQGEPELKKQVSGSGEVTKIY